MSQNFLEFPKESEAKLSISGPAGTLELRTSVPHKNEKSMTAVICHPHPLYGGTMHNKVVYTTSRALNELGIKTVRFNFRGVGDSTGNYSNGVGETDDLLAVLHWLTAVIPGDEICLAGFSFGAYVATRTASLFKAKLLITIAPPVQSFDFSTLIIPSYPWVVIQGEEDEIVAPTLVYNFVENLDPAPKLIKIPHAGHFFHGKLIELRKAIIETVKDYL